MIDRKIHEELIRKEFTALHNPIVRVMIVAADDSFHMNFSHPKKKKDAGETEMFWDVEEVIKNLDGIYSHHTGINQIYIMPIEQSPGNIYLLIDDVRKEFLDIEAGLIDTKFRPNLLLRSSPASYQAVFVLPFVHDGISDDGREIYTQFFRHLNNKKYGDPKINSLRHAIRLVGFTNRKPKHKRSDGTFPTVEIVSCSQPVYPEMLALYDGFKKSYLADYAKARLAKPPSRQAGPQPANAPPDASPDHSAPSPYTPAYTASYRPTISADEAWARHKADILAHSDALPFTQVDMRIAERLTLTGHSFDAIARAIQNNTERDRSDNANYALSTAKQAQKTAPGQDKRMYVYCLVEGAIPIARPLARPRSAKVDGTPHAAFASVAAGMK